MNVDWVFLETSLTLNFKIFISQIHEIQIKKDKSDKHQVEELMRPRNLIITCDTLYVIEEKCNIFDRRLYLTVNLMWCSKN